VYEYSQSVETEQEMCTQCMYHVWHVYCALLPIIHDSYQ